jgi:hypothetical protein
MRLLAIAKNAFVETIRQPIFLVLILSTFLVLVMDLPLAGWTLGNVYAKQAGPLVADIVRAFDSSDIRLISVTFSSPSLDDVFLKHTGRRIRTEELVKAPSAMFGGRR